jgi:hypothetical protein
MGFGHFCNLRGLKLNRFGALRGLKPRPPKEKAILFPV